MSRKSVQMLLITRPNMTVSTSIDESLGHFTESFPVYRRSLAMVDYSKSPTKRMFDELTSKEARSVSLNTSTSL